MRKLIQFRIMTLRSKVDMHMQKSQSRYKQDYDRRVCETPSFLVAQHVFLEMLPLRATPEISANTLAGRTYNMLQRVPRDSSAS